MRIKTRIKLGIILSLVLATTIALLLFLGTCAVNEASRADIIAVDVVKGVAELKIVTHEYILHPEERSLMQWRSRYDFLSETLTGGHFKSPDGKILADQIFKDLERFKTVFSDLVTGLQKRQTLGKQERVAFRELQYRLMDDLLVKSQLAASLAFQLHQKMEAKLMTTQKMVSFLTLLLLLTLTATIIGISLWVNRSIARPIAKLEKDTLIIGSGNLDHKVGIRAKDEIGELSRAFDKMTQNLKETTTSIVELNKEIAERKQAEEALRESERFLQNVFDGIQDGISVLDRDLTIIGCNFWMEDQYAEHMPLIGKKCYKVYQGLQSPCPGCPSIPAIETGEVHSEVVPYPSAEEPSGWIELSSFPLTDRSDSVVGVIEHVKDITAKKLAEEALRESEERFRTVADFAYDWEFWIAPDGRYLYVSPSCERITGYTPDEFINDPGLLEKIVHPDDHSTVVKHLGEEQDLEKLPPRDFRIITRKGEERWINHVCQAVYGADGVYLGRRGSNRDISKQKLMQEELLKAKKLESLGVLAGGIAHDFNNLMSAVVGNISLARIDMKPGSKGFKNLVEAEKASIQTKALTARLITFSEGGGPVKETVSIGNLIKDSVGSSLKGSDIDVGFSIPDDISPVEVDEEQMKQAIYNIVTNAQEAMAGQGTINVSCENTDIGEKDTLILKNGKYVKISIEDQGPGIPEEDLIKIFDPYFSTKDMGTQKGMGLGLAISDSIIKQHDGLITVKSELGTGTIFSIYLPAASAKRPSEIGSALHGAGEEPGAEPPLAESEEVDSQYSIKRVLVMDDEELVRDVSNALLTHIGYKVEVAVEGVEAIEMYEQAMESEKPFDVVILDLTNKVGMGGTETIVRLLEIDPNVKAIVATGYSGDPIMSNFREHGFRSALPKPFSLDQLRTALQDAIATE